MSETVIYARVSTEEQAKKGFSIPSQLEQCHGYCRRYGFSIGLELTDDESGAILARDGITRLRELVRAGAVRRVVVWRQDRLARDELSYFTLRNEFRKHGTEIHAVNRGGKVDGLYASLEAVLDADEKERIRDRTMRGRKDKALRGRIVGHGPVPYGYTREGEGEKITWQIDEVAAKVVRSIFDMYVRELISPAEIATRLTASESPTPSQRRSSAGAHRKAPPGQWNREAVRWILRNSSYAGTFYAYRTNQPRGDEPNKRPPVRVNPREEWIPISVPALVDQELFQLAQRRLDAAPQLAFRNTKHEYLIGRRVRCACGLAATGSTSSLSGRNTKRYPYYSCNSRRRSKDRQLEPCGIPPFRADHADETVWRWIREELLTYKKLHEHIARRDAERAKRAKAVDPTVLRAAKLEKLKADRERLNKAYVTGVQSFEEYAPTKRALDKEILELEAIPPEPPAYQPMSLALVETLIDEYSEELNRANFELRRFLVDHLDIRVVLKIINDQKHLYIHTGILDLEATIPLNV